MTDRLWLLLLVAVLGAIARITRAAFRDQAGRASQRSKAEPASFGWLSFGFDAAVLLLSVGLIAELASSATPSV